MLFALLLLPSWAMDRVSDFQGKAFQFTNKPSGIYQVDVGLEANFASIMTAYGDFNSDKAVDVVVVDQDRSKVSILYWIDAEFEMKIVCEKCYPSGLDAAYQISGIIPLDFNYDGCLDLLVIYQIEGVDQYFITYLQQKQPQTGDFPEFTQEILSEQGSDSFPFVADFLGNHRSTIMITSHDERQILVEGQEAIPFMNLVNIQSENCKGKLEVDKVLKSKILTPHFNSFVDISQDCRADLIITSEEGIEYWYTDYTKDEWKKDLVDYPRFCLKSITKIADDYKLKALSFVDINFDGAVDMVTITHQSSINEQFFVIYYNQIQNPSTGDICQFETSHDNQVSKYPYEQAFAIMNTSSSVATKISNASDHQPLFVYEYESSNLSQILAPFLRFGDYLAEGTPGALVLLSKGTATAGAVQYAANVECTDSGLKVANPRCLVIQVPGHGFDQITNLMGINAAFYDYGENGRLDILVNSCKEVMSSPGLRCSITAFYNYISLDAFFLKSLGTDGQCQSNDESQVSCLGALYYGLTYQFNVTTINGKYRPAVGVQLYQSAFTPLQLPYSYVGVGRTNNYIENYFAGMPLYDGALKKWTPIIPNSQLIVSPNTAQTEKWTLSIFIEPTEAILVVVIVTVVILLVLGGIIVWKHIKEKEEDKQNQEQFNQMFR